MASKRIPCTYCSISLKFWTLGRLLCKIVRGSKMGPFHKRHKSYATQNGAISLQIVLNSSLTWRLRSSRASEWSRLEVANRGLNLIYHVITWYLVEFICNTIIRPILMCQWSWHRFHLRDASSGAETLQHHLSVVSTLLILPATYVRIIAVLLMWRPLQYEQAAV